MRADRTADVARLAEALRVGEPWPGAPAPEVIAARLLPAVDAIADERARQRAAGALEAAADNTLCPWDRDIVRNRAAALRGAP